MREFALLHGLFEIALADGKIRFERNSPKPFPKVQRGTRTEIGATCAKK